MGKDIEKIQMKLKDTVHKLRKLKKTREIDTMDLIEAVKDEIEELIKEYESKGEVKILNKAKKLAVDALGKTATKRALRAVNTIQAPGCNTKKMLSELNACLKLAQTRKKELDKAIEEEEAAEEAAKAVAAKL